MLVIYDITWELNTAITSTLGRSVRRNRNAKQIHPSSMLFLPRGKRFFLFRKWEIGITFRRNGVKQYRVVVFPPLLDFLSVSQTGCNGPWKLPVRTGSPSQLGIEISFVKPKAGSKVLINGHTSGPELYSREGVVGNPESVGSTSQLPRICIQIAFFFFFSFFFFRALSLSLFFKEVITLSCTRRKPGRVSSASGWV